MITINADTKIASVIRQHPDALETIVSLSPKFTKLRNPILRKVMASRTSIAMASRVGGCSLDDFFSKLKPLGFAIDCEAVSMETATETTPVPDFMKKVMPDNIIDLDVRPVIENGKDPLDIIVQKVKALEAGSVLKIVNSFEPTPLIHLLGKQGFESFTEWVNDELVNTFFYKAGDKPLAIESKEKDHGKGWEAIAERFKDKFVTIDVRELEMPLPLHSILAALQSLPIDKALFVYHKRIPVFLLPELEEQLFSYRIREISDGEVHMLIYKN